MVWIPKYRKKILVGEVQKELKTLIQKCADKRLPAQNSISSEIRVFVLESCFLRGAS
ncbi:MAG: transposase [Chlamydiota bacterium]